VITIPKRHRRTDGRTTCNLITALSWRYFCASEQAVDNSKWPRPWPTELLTHITIDPCPTTPPVTSNYIPIFVFSHINRNTPSRHSYGDLRLCPNPRGEEILRLWVWCNRATVTRDEVLRFNTGLCRFQTYYQLGCHKFLIRPVSKLTVSWSFTINCNFVNTLASNWIRARAPSPQPIGV